MFRTKRSRCRDVILEGRTIELGEPMEVGKGNGEGEVSLQATWDQGGRASHHTERRDSKQVRGTRVQREPSRGVIKGELSKGVTKGLHHVLIVFRL